MKVKKLIILIASVILLATAAPAAVAAYSPDPGSFSEAVTAANQEMQDLWRMSNFFSTSVTGKPVNESTWNAGITLRNKQTHALVFGNPHGDIKNGYHRYLGYAKTDEDFSNIQFPIEVWGRSHIEDYDWIEHPWTDPRVWAAWGRFYSTPFDDDVTGNHPLPLETREQFNKSIIIGLLYEYYQGKQIAGDGVWDVDWIRFVHVYQPPTAYSWGMGRAWNLGSDGGIYYKTFSIAPLNWNYFAVKPDSATIDVGETVQYKAFFNNSEVTTLSTWSVGSASIATISADIGQATGVAPGSTSITATYTPSGGSTLSDSATLVVNEKKPETPATPANPGSSDNPSGDNPGSGSGGSGSLTFQAHSQPGTIDVLTGQPGPIITRTPGTAKWTDTVTAMLTTPEPPRPSKPVV
jgi:hypothetical protein